MELLSPIFTLFALALLLLAPFLDIIDSRRTHYVCQTADITS